MVAAGALTRTTAQENNVALLPVDSEHSGVQALQGERRDTINVDPDHFGRGVSGLYVREYAIRHTQQSVITHLGDGAADHS